MRRHHSRWKTAFAATACAVLAAACGSDVPPDQFLNAQGVNNGVPVAGANGSGTNGGGTGTGGGGNGSTNGGGTGTGGGGTGGGVGTGGGGTGGGGTGGGGTGGGHGGGGHGGGGHGGGGHGGSSGGGATQGVQPGSCSGFKNTTGITNSTITIANVSDVSGPVPGLFKAAQAAVTAYVAYFNSTSSICGRKLKVTDLDSGTSESGDQQAAQTACSNAFATVGSMGAFDGGGASTTAGCGQPDIRAASTETARWKSPTSFGAYSLAIPDVPDAQFKWFKSLGSGVASNAAFVYLNAGASSLNAQSFIAAETKMGYNFKDKIAIDVTSVPNYNGYATQLKNDGIKYVQYIGAYQYAVKLKSAFYQAQYNPVFVMDPTAYDPGYVSAGTPVNGTYSFVPGPLFEEANRNPQVQNYISWLQRTSGGAPNFFGVYAWSAASLFTQLAVQLGGKLTRSSLVSALKGVHNWTDNGMHPPQDVGGKITGPCSSIVQLENGKWIRKTKYPYTCGGLVNSGVGG
jgi:ABC-type branched-subunit amino acid transport system substrate-binding protein